MLHAREILRIRIDASFGSQGHNFLFRVDRLRFVINVEDDFALFLSGHTFCRSTHDDHSFKQCAYATRGVVIVVMCSRKPINSAERGRNWRAIFAPAG
jgi:hypothetical protein